MGKKKKSKNKKTGTRPALSPDQENLLTTLLGDLKGIDPSRINEQIHDPVLAQIFVERLPIDAPETPAIVKAVHDAFDRKAVRKAAKKAIFKLSQKGIAVPALAEKDPSPELMKKAEKETPRAYIGPVDGTGNRGIFLLIPKRPRGVDVGMGIINDEKGIREFYTAEYSKRQMREVRALFFERIPNMVETTPSHAAGLLENAHKRNEDKPSADYLALRPRIMKQVDPAASPPIYDHIQQDEITRVVLTDSQIEKLINHPIMNTWLIEPERATTLVQEIIEAKQSPVLVSEEQIQDRIQEIKRKALVDSYPDDRREMLGKRLEETAFVFHKLGEEDLARISLSVARALEKTDSTLAVNPFLKALMDRCIDLYLKAFKGETPESAPEGRRDDTTPSIILP